MDAYKDAFGVFCSSKPTEFSAVSESNKVVKGFPL